MTPFLINYSKNKTAKAHGAFGSDNPGRVKETNSLFHSGFLSLIPNSVLTKSFGVSSHFIDELTRAIAPPTATECSALGCVGPLRVQKEAIFAII
jgi:hypothetical protein